MQPLSTKDKITIAAAGAALVFVFTYYAVSFLLFGI